MQFPFVDDPAPLRPQLSLFHRRHQVSDQCARVHFRNLKMDSYHGTRKTSFQFRSFPPQRIFVRIQSNLKPLGPARHDSSCRELRQVFRS